MLYLFYVEVTVLFNIIIYLFFFCIVNQTELDLILLKGDTLKLIIIFVVSERKGRIIQL